MKRITVFVSTACAVALIVFGTIASVPRLINYQGILTDDTGVPITGIHDLTFAIYPDSTQGATVLWSEPHAGVEINAGLFNVILGKTVTIPDSLFAGGDRWMGITIDAGSEMTPRMQLTSVPWAFRAAVDVGGGDHAATHQNGGADELNVEGLSGVLADPQTPATHAASHSDGSSDPISHGNLAGIGETDHHDNANDPTASEKAALAGEGTPSGTNKYTTKSYVDGRPHTKVVSGTKPHTDTNYTAGIGYTVAITVDAGYALADALATGYQTNLGGNSTGLLRVETNVNGGNLEFRVYDSGGNEPDGGGWPPSTRVRIDYLAIVTK